MTKLSRALQRITEMLPNDPLNKHAERLNAAARELDRKLREDAEYNETLEGETEWHLPPPEPTMNSQSPPKAPTSPDAAN